jgi:hypothetical protein
LSIAPAQWDDRGVYGRRSRCLYAVWSNPAPGVSPERFREYYEDVHRPDTLAIGHFERSYRYEAQSECRARYLTLWEAEHPDLASALERVRKGALALREQGRIWPVQEVVFHQFGFARESGASPETRVEALTTAQNDWSAPARGHSPGAWARAAMPDASALAARYAAQFLYASGDRFFWLGESEASGEALEDLWRGRASGLPPLGRPTPIFPAPDADPEPDVAQPGDPRAAWVVHWKPI